MTNILICTGSKKQVSKIMLHFKDLDRKKIIEILNGHQISKRAMFMKYEELKILFLSKEGASLPIPAELIKKVENFSIRKGHKVMMTMSSFRSEDATLRWNIISRATTFKLKGGHLKIDETTEEEHYKTYRICTMTMAGPANMAMELKNQLIKDRLVDPKSVVYKL